MGLRIGEELVLEANELVAGGSALCRSEGLPVFVVSMFPGDTARVRLTEVKKGYARGEIVEILRPSPQRRLEPCPIAGECGGCDWTALRLDYQLLAKQRILSESLRRIGKLDLGTLPPIAVHPSPLNYRLRSRLHRDGDAVGFFALRSNRVVPLVPECEVVGPVTARSPVEGQSWEIAGEVITGEKEIELPVGEFRYHLSTDAFFQVNRHLLPTLLRLVSAHASRTRGTRLAVDLYAGVGFFSAPLAKRFETVIAVEGFEKSARWARVNLPPNAEVVHAASEEWVQRMPQPDLLFLDPPRAGAHRRVIEAVAERTREMVCYLSCDPVTFARDASRLIASGWRLTSLDLLDLFPNTHHVETLSSFERAVSPP
ncbi:MAG TPA: hypothetical protein VFL80_01440 [Thermoanaerobaculia bacterium]|nr:hypothetical protein [Thermoanaerobaculia bacterium]